MDWLYRFIRRRTRPIPRHRARYVHDKLSLLYFMLGWTGAGIALFGFLTHEPDSLPENLNIHGQQNGKYDSSFYQAARHINRLDNDLDIKVVNITNFTLQSVDKIDISDLKKTRQETQRRQKEDFFDGAEISQEGKE